MIPSVNSDRSRPEGLKSTLAALIRREESVTSKASSIISTAATAGTGRRTSLTDLDKDDVSDTDNDSKEVFKKTTDENENENEVKY